MTTTRPLARFLLLSVAGLPILAACAGAYRPPPPPELRPITEARVAPPDPDPRTGLQAGLFDAGEAVWNLRVVSTTPPPEAFVGAWNSDLAFTGTHTIQGNALGFQIWDSADPGSPELVTVHVCPGSQGDVSVYRHLLFVSVEGFEGRLDCGAESIQDPVSPERLRGIRIFDIGDVRNPRYVGGVQTCRGSHTHTVVEHPGDAEHVYVYVSGVLAARPAAELAGCAGAPPEQGSILSHIEVIRVPIAQPERAAIVATPSILGGLVVPPRHGPTPDDLGRVREAEARGGFVVQVELMGEPLILPPAFVSPMLAAMVEARGGTGGPTAADSATLRAALPSIFAALLDPLDRPSICHDLTVYEETGLAAAACVGYGVLLDIRDPVSPRRLDAVADSNFVVWHSATFSHDGTKVLFTDEWGGGLAAKCQAGSPRNWGANAIFTIENGRLRFRSYYKVPAVQSPMENCVAHNGSLIPIPGRDVQVQGWYQGGVSVFDWTDPDNLFEIAFHDRGPLDANELTVGGSWSAYWYNGFIFSSEIARGLDIFELTPSPHLSRNEIDAAKTVRFDYLNPQSQPRFVWPATFVLSRAYVDQLERSGGLSAERIAEVRSGLDRAESATGAARQDALLSLAAELDVDARASHDAAKVRTLAGSVRELALAPA